MRSTPYFDAGEAVDGAAVWFSADPPPKSLYIGRWATTDVATTLRGGSPAVIGDLSIANATFTVAENNVTANLSAATTYAAVATTLQALIRTAGGGEVTGVTIGTPGSWLRSVNHNRRIQRWWCNPSGDWNGHGHSWSGHRSLSEHPRQRVQHRSHGHHHR